MAFPEILRTSRLTLRRWQDEHVEAMTAVWADPEVWRALRPGEPFDRAFAASRAQLHVRHWHEPGGQPSGDRAAAARPHARGTAWRSGREGESGGDSRSGHGFATHRRG